MPICSSACESAENPPSPTQNAEYDSPSAQFAFGCTQVPVTFVYWTGVPVAGFVPVTA